MARPQRAPQPELRRSQTLGLEAADAHTARLAGLQQTALLEEPQVLHHRRE
ncbi:MAG TPA: hypothetical protein VEU54_11660 [Steroidobacteraceae bacterium]|nr:hypothetical protein [Steroidobacteraceae bacterium]